MLAGALGALWLGGGTDARPLATLQALYGKIHGLIDRELEALRDKTDHKLVTSGLEFAAGHGKATSLQNPTLSISSDHTVDDHLVCGRPRSRSRADTGSNLFYRWVDDDGQTHLSDTQPTHAIASVIDLAGSKRDFTYSIEADGVKLPIKFQGQINAGSKRMYDTWHFFLGEANLRQSHIKLRLIGGAGRYDAFQAKAWPNGKPSSGFYSLARNEAYVKYEANADERALAVSFHEISHLITATHLGPTPPWLTEGLAEYFETMEVKSQLGIIKPNIEHIRLLRSSRLPQLDSFFSLDRTQWHGDQRSLNYAIAWSVTHFLMSGAPGMYAMQEVIRQSHANLCQPFSPAAVLADQYPGGLIQLERDWKIWLSGSQFPTHQT